jgi:hypothetical protein
VGKAFVWYVPVKTGFGPVLGWTMLSRDETRLAERSLASGAQETRDEIGFLLIHQGFADRFFPGTSVLHTRVRYALFVPWLYQRAAKTSGTDASSAVVGRLFIKLARRLKEYGREPLGVIGGDILGQPTSQPPDRVYWRALKSWGLLLPDVDSRRNALRLLKKEKASATDDDGGALDDRPREVFAGLPPWPAQWTDDTSKLNFALSGPEREYLRSRLRVVARPGVEVRSLLARLIESGQGLPAANSLPHELDQLADAADAAALATARSAAALSAIGRAVYGALVEVRIARDAGQDDRTFRSLLPMHFDRHGDRAADCDLTTLTGLLPDLPRFLVDVLAQTLEYVRQGKPSDFASLLSCYRSAEVRRKTAQRSRLGDGPRAAERRAEWRPDRHNTTPLHYRWRVVQSIAADLSSH